ncbi:MAG: hypothetical protein ACE5H9_16650 [Anaerolineae bacterium]
MVENQNSSPPGPLPVQVQCYSGSVYAERPRRIAWQGHWQTVSQVLDRWRAPQGPGFRVSIESGLVLALQYHEQTDHWTAIVQTRR